MGIRKKLLQLVLVLAVGVGSPSIILASGRVLVVHSHHAGFNWVQQINAALEPRLKKAAIPYRIFYMDTKRKSDFAWKLESAKQARQLIESYLPEVVIAIDDVAQAYVARNYVGNGPIQIVFAGVNANPDFFGYPAKNVAGILERTYPGQVLKMFKRIAPWSKRMVWISDDSATANLVLSRVRQKSESGQLPLAIAAFLQPVTFKQWQGAIRKYNADPSIAGLLIPLYHTVKDRVDGHSISPADVMIWTVNNTQKPIIGLWPFSTDDGALCTVAVDPNEHGKVAAIMTKQILDGKSAGDLPVMVNKDGYVIINMIAAARLNIHVPFEMLLSADKIIE